MSLLSKAQQVQIKSRNKIELSDEDVELAIAWLKGEVRYVQVCRAYDKKKGSATIYSMLARSLREAYYKGIIQIS